MRTIPHLGRCSRTPFGTSPRPNLRSNAGTHDDQDRRTGAPAPRPSRQMNLTTGDEKHGSAATSNRDALRVPYHRVPRVTPATVDDPEPDRFLLSTGHGAMAHYGGPRHRRLLRRGSAVRFRRVPPAAGTPLGPTARPGHRDRQRITATRTAAGRRQRARPAGAGAHRSAGPDPGRGRRSGQGSNREAIAHAGPAGLDQLHTLVIDNASAASFPGSKRPAGRSRPWTGASTRRCTRPAPHPTPASSRSDHPRRPKS